MTSRRTRGHRPRRRTSVQPSNVPSCMLDTGELLQPPPPVHIHRKRFRRKEPESKSASPAPLPEDNAPINATNRRSVQRLLHASLPTPRWTGPMSVEQQMLAEIQGGLASDAPDRGWPILVRLHRDVDRAGCLLAPLLPPAIRFRNQAVCSVAPDCDPPSSDSGMRAAVNSGRGSLHVW